MSHIHDILKRNWGYEKFRQGQEEIINSILNGNDTLALLPTGGGKSITYQIPSLAMEGICIVVSPLIALMKDQVNRLEKLKIKSLAVYSGMTYHEIDITLDNAVFGDFKFLYVSPERLETDIFRLKLEKMKVNLIAVDESHCISQWGYDFRPSYLNIHKIRPLFPHVPVLALTATATPEVIKDIQDKLNFKKENVIKTSFKRHNVVLAVRETEDKDGQLINAVKKIQGSGIIYVRNRKNTKDLSQLLKNNGISADYYHAGLRHETRNQKQEEWTNGKTRVICSTNAFGMGIDKANVRFVFHYDIPDSPEAYFQEAGRAGRDEKKSYAALFYNSNDIANSKRRISVNFPEIKEIKRIYNALCNYYQIPVGGAKGNVYDFNISDFCKAYGLNLLTTFNSLKLLQTEGYLEFTDDVNNPARVFFIIDRDDLYKFQLANKNLDAIIKLLLRSYTGLFSNYVSIDETALAGRSGLKKEDIYNYMIILSKQKIINYIPQKKTPLIVFTEERLEEKNLTISVKNYSWRKNRFQERVDYMLHYVQSTNMCRNIILLNYFGETANADCGKCDVCLANKEENLTNFEYGEIKKIIVEQLEKTPKSPADFEQSIPFNKEKITKSIRIMLDENLLMYNNHHMLIIKPNK